MGVKYAKRASATPGSLGVTLFNSFCILNGIESLSIRAPSRRMRSQMRRGSFTSVTDLRRQIERFVADWNQHPKPFVRTATAESILAKLEPLGKVICRTRH